jgi:hypothetical protein
MILSSIFDCIFVLLNHNLKPVNFGRSFLLKKTLEKSTKILMISVPFLSRFLAIFFVVFFHLQRALFSCPGAGEKKKFQA